MDIYKKVKGAEFSGKGLDAKLSGSIEEYEDWMWIQELRHFIKIMVDK